MRTSCHSKSLTDSPQAYLNGKNSQRRLLQNARRHPAVDAWVDCHRHLPANSWFVLVGHRARHVNVGAGAMRGRRICLRRVSRAASRVPAYLGYSLREAALLGDLIAALAPQDDSALGIRHFVVNCPLEIHGNGAIFCPVPQRCPRPRPQSAEVVIGANFTARISKFCSGAAKDQTRRKN